MVSIADTAAELTNAFVRSFLACRGTGCKSNICRSAAPGLRREMAMGKLPHAVLLSLLGACLALARQPFAAETAAPSCAGAQRPKQVAELLFGRDIGRRLGVSESAFAHFVARELTPRFPDGLTITDATGSGAIRRTAGIVREADETGRNRVARQRRRPGQARCRGDGLQARIPPALGRRHRAVGLRRRSRQQSQACWDLRLLRVLPSFG